MIDLCVVDKEIRFMSNGTTVSDSKVYIECNLMECMVGRWLKTV